MGYRGRVYVRIGVPGQPSVEGRCAEAGGLFAEGGLVRFLDRGKVQGGQELDVDAPVEKLPLFIRAGSIVPMGPEIEYTGQKPADPIEVRIYRGADGAFNLYEDEGDSDRYEQGAHAAIPMHWNEASGTLTLGEREGTFPGMVKDRKFRIVLVGPGHGVGEAVSSRADNVVEYTGKSEEISFPSKGARH